MALTFWYPGGGVTRAPWYNGELYRVPRLGSGTKALYLPDSGSTPFIVDGAVGGRLTVESVSADIVPFGGGAWKAGSWYFDGAYLLPAPGDASQTLVTWMDSLGNTGKQYVGTAKYYQLIGFDGTTTSGTANIMGEANDPDDQQTATWTYTPPQVWRLVSDTGDYTRSAAPYSLLAAGRYEPFAGGASGSLSVGQGAWWCSARSEGVWEDGAGTGLLSAPSNAAAAIPKDDAKFIIATDPRGRWTHTGMPTRGQGFTAAWEWGADVPQEERVDPPSSLSFSWLGYGLIHADNESSYTGRVYAYDLTRMM